MRNEQNYTNQTEFALEEPLFSPEGTPAPEEERAVVVRQPWWKKKPLLIGAIVGVTVFVLLVLALINAVVTASRRPQVPVVDAPAASDAPASDPLYNELLSLEKQLKTANPNQAQFAFPAVDMNLRIDEKRR